MLLAILFFSKEHFCFATTHSVGSSFDLIIVYIPRWSPNFFALFGLHLLTILEFIVVFCLVMLYFVVASCAATTISLIFHPIVVSTSIV